MASLLLDIGNADGRGEEDAPAHAAGANRPHPVRDDRRPWTCQTIPLRTCDVTIATSRASARAGAGGSARPAGTDRAEAGWVGRRRAGSGGGGRPRAEAGWLGRRRAGQIMTKCDLSRRKPPEIARRWSNRDEMRATDAANARRAGRHRMRQPIYLRRYAPTSPGGRRNDSRETAGARISSSIGQRGPLESDFRLRAACERRPTDSRRATAFAPASPRRPRRAHRRTSQSAFGPPSRRVSRSVRRERVGQAMGSGGHIKRAEHPDAPAPGQAGGRRPVRDAGPVTLRMERRTGDARSRYARTSRTHSRNCCEDVVGGTCAPSRSNRAHGANTASGSEPSLAARVRVTRAPSARAWESGHLCT
jgi:hypothetical protein